MDYIDFYRLIRSSKELIFVLKKEGQISVEKKDYEVIEAALKRTIPEDCIIERSGVFFTLSCRSCNKLLKSTENFCPNCGQRINFHE